MTEDKLEQFIRDAARDYNRPPEITPREDMWARIQESQRAEVAVPVLRVERGTAAPKRTFVQRTQWWGLAAAAGILLVAGISIGRFTSRNAAPSAAQSQAPQVAVATPTVAEPGTSVNPAIEAPVKSEPTPKNPMVRLASAVPASGQRRSARTQLDVEANRMNATYQLASLRHLAETEALLTTFRTDSANRAMDPVVAKWSRDLLSNTRLLLDSPAARDPLRKHLLEDLELVLTQIVQLSNTPNANERDMVESTIKEGHVMTRLRTAIPAGRPQGT